MAAQDMPAAEVAMDASLVRALLADQHPDLSGLPVTLLANGWDNVLFRLGDDLVVRLPRREVAVALIGHEQRWLPALALHLPLPVPTPLRVGGPGRGYPWPWSICLFQPGASALAEPITDHLDAALALGRFLSALHQPAPPDAPANPYRGVPLADRAHLTEGAIDQLDDVVDGPRLRELWRWLMTTPPWPGPPVWVHGDLHPGNLIVRGGRLAAVVDFGDLTSGDPATDLAVAWMAFPPEVRPLFRAVAGEVDDATWARSRAWALALGLAVLLSSADNPAYAAHGHRTLAAVLED